MLDSFKRIFREKGDVLLKIKARPGAETTKIKGILKTENEEIIKIDIAGAPEKGRANQELIKFLAEEFAVSEKNVKIVSGLNSKLKLVKITDNL